MNPHPDTFDRPGIERWLDGHGPTLLPRLLDATRYGLIFHDAA